MVRGDETSEPVDAVLRFDSEAGHWVAEEQWNAAQEVEELPDGSVLFRVNVVVTPDFVGWILHYGSRVKVLEPESLRDRVIEEHRKAAEMYGREAGGVRRED